MTTYKLGDICEIVSGGTPKTGVKEYWGGDLKWITPAEIKDNSYIVDDSVRKITQLAVDQKRLPPFPKGTVILSSRAPIGKVAIAGCEMYCNQGFKNLICSDIINNRYLYWFLKSRTSYLNSLGRGATFKEISKSIVSNIEIDIPELQKQENIADEFEKINDVIELRRKEISSLDELIKARFVEMFGDPASNEKHWRIKDLENVTTIITYGLTIRPKYIKDGIPLISARELHKGYISYEEAPTISKEDFEKLSDKGKPHKDDILFSKTGSIGHCALVENDELFAITQNVARMGLKIEAVNPEWLLSYLRMDFIQDWCKAHAKGNAVKDFQLQDMKVIPLFDCPLELQKQFADFVCQIDKSKAAVQKALDETQLLFDSLMQKYFK